MRSARQEVRWSLILGCVLIALLSFRILRADEDTALPACDRTELIQNQLKGLRSSDADVRAQAACWLGALRAKEAIPVLLESIADQDGQVRACAIGALGAIGDETLIPVLVSRIEGAELASDIPPALERIDKNWRKRPDVQARYQDYEARLRQRYLESPPEDSKTSGDRVPKSARHERAEFAVMEQLDPDRAHRFYVELVAANALPEGGSFWVYYRLEDHILPDSAPLLVKALSQFTGSRFEAQHVLLALEKADPGWRQSPPAKNLALDLIRWTRDHPERVKLEAVIAILEAIRDPVAIPVLVRTANERLVSAQGRELAVSALAAIPGTETRAVLLQLWGEEDPVLRSPVLAAIAALKDPGDIPLLKRGAANKALEPECRLRALQALLDLDPDSLDLVLDVIRDESEQEYLRGQCVNLASATKNKECIPVLVNLLRSGSVYAGVVIDALGDLRASEAVGDLFQLLESQEAGYIDTPIATALVRITGQEGTTSLIRFGREHPRTAPAIAASLAAQFGRETPSVLVELLSLLASNDVQRSSPKYILDSAREAVLDVVAEQPTPETIPAIEALLKDDSARVRAKAQYALYRIKNR